MEWSVHGKVMQQVAARSYKVQLTDGRKLSRNQRLVRERYINFTAARVVQASLKVEPLERALEDQKEVEGSHSDDVKNCAQPIG